MIRLYHLYIFVIYSIVSHSIYTVISEKDFLVNKGVFSFAGYLNPFLQKFPHLDISVDSQVQNHVPSSQQGGDGRVSQSGEWGW